MRDVRANVILAEMIEDNSIKNIIKSLPANVENVIWMYLTVKSNLDVEEEIHIGFDIVNVDQDKDFGIELGEFIIGKTNDEEKRKELLESMKNGKIQSELTAEKGRSIFPFKEIFTVGQKFPPLPALEVGRYEFVVYEKYENENYILDTFQFEVK